jgi:hypothetical protein
MIKPRSNTTMDGGKPAFLITMDTEGDNLWSKPAFPTTGNSKFLPRFQALCERNGLKPTWLTNWEMANCVVFQEFGRDVQRRNTGEIGMHLHAWDTPPLSPLTANDSKHHPYLFEFSERLMREKIRTMTELLEERFESKMVSHRAGRWGFTAQYARLLAEFGYRIDCSVTPHVSWASVGGDPRGSGGRDFSHYPTVPYFMDLDDICQEGNSTLLEAPMSIVRRYSFAQPIESYVPLVRRYVNRVFPAVVWMRPTGRNLRFLLEMLDQARAERWPYVEFMLHSSELMPGSSPTFRDEDSIEKLYEDLEALFEAAGAHFQGATLSEFHDSWTARRGPGRVTPAREQCMEPASTGVAAD